MVMTGVAAGCEPHRRARLPFNAPLPPHHPDVLFDQLLGGDLFVLTHDLWSPAGGQSGPRRPGGRPADSPR